MKNGGEKLLWEEAIKNCMDDFFWASENLAYLLC
jgi:hypothetical protein